MRTWRWNQTKVKGGESTDYSHSEIRRVAREIAQALSKDSAAGTGVERRTEEALFRFQE
jgi:hypothetical protein